jgi:hypothetical protein
LVAKLPSATGKIAKTITDIGALANIALEGQGKEKHSKLAKAVMIRNAERGVHKMMTSDLSKLQNTENKLLDSYTAAAMSGETEKAETLEPKIQRVQKKVEGLLEMIKGHSEALRRGSKDIKSMATYGYGSGKGKESRARAPSASRDAVQLQPSSRFASQLEKESVDPLKYLQMAQRFAQRAGYPYKKLQFSSKADKKLMVPNQSGQMVHFGQVGYGDFVLYSLKGDRKLADQKRRLYLNRAQKIPGDWREDKYSPNNLAIWILWPPTLK